MTEARTIIVACTSVQRFFDLDAVRTTPVAKPQRFFSHSYGRGGTNEGQERRPETEPVNRSDPAGAPPLDHWWTDDPWAIPLASMVPTKVCQVCGKPSERVIGAVRYLTSDGVEVAAGEWASGVAEGKGAHSNKAVSATRIVETAGWTDCEHDAWRAGRTYNPFPVIPEGTTVANAKYLLGDVFERMAEMADASFDLVMCSPPFFGLRDYLAPDDPAKVHEIGSEGSPAEWMDVMLRLTAEWRRLLAPHGSIAIELGDKYSSGDTGDTEAAGWPLGKSLMMLPTLYAAGLAYGSNLLTGTPSPAGRWRVRNVVVWARPNPAVGSLGDKYRPSTSYMTVAAPNANRYFDMEAVRAPGTSYGRVQENKGHLGAAADPENNGAAWMDGKPLVHHEAGAPPLDHWYPLDDEADYWADDLWSIPTYGFPGAHFATWPPMLCVRPIKSMVPEKVCTTCGEPSRRIVEATKAYAANLHAATGEDMYQRTDAHAAGARASARPMEGVATAEYKTVGWTDCGHNTWRLGCVLDPFAGSGTTLMVATGNGRDAVGIDLDKRNVDMAEDRIGPFFFERG